MGKIICSLASFLSLICAFVNLHLGKENEAIFWAILFGVYYISGKIDELIAKKMV
jgi:hypothetical protein